MSKKFLIIASLLLGLTLVISLDKPLFSGKMSNFLAATLFVESITVNELQVKFDNAEVGEKVRILLMPGHEPDYGGAEFGSVSERDMNVDLALLIAEEFKADPRFEITIARDKEEWYLPLEAYFENNWEIIKSFTRTKKIEMDEAISSKVIPVKESSGVKHNKVSDDVALRLYGINKWASERNMDLVLHIHFNDHPRSRMSAPGIYKGFAIYVPDKIFSNHTASKEIALNVFENLKSSFDVSDFPPESEGIIESRSLIAVGARNTLDSASILVEYGYIYRPVFASAYSRKDTLGKMAELTYLGVRDFFEE